MRIICISLLFLSGVCFAAKNPEKVLENALKNLRKSGRVSAQIVNLTNTRELVSVDDDKPLNPASSIKLFTAYSALKRLGINFQFKTDFFRAGEGLCVRGGGDPSFVMEDLYLVVQALKRKGLTSYSGKITLDATAFDSELIPEDRTDQDSERAYNSPIAGLNFNYNTITAFVNPTRKGEPARVGLDWPFPFVKVNSKVITSGSGTDVTWDKKTLPASKGADADEIVSLGGKIAVDADEWRKPFRLRDPSRGFGFALAKMLKDSGVEGPAVPSLSEGTCGSGDPFYSYASKPLSFIVQLMDKYSNNFIADSLVKALDHEVNRHSGTAAGGLNYIRNDLKQMGIDVTSKGRSMVSGSGLTDSNSFSASDFIKLLKVIHKEKLYLPEIFTSLPIAGVDGTLKRKYVRTSVSERLRGKTGSLSGVQSLVGIYPNSDGEWLAIAIIVNGGISIPEVELTKFLATQ